MAALQQTNTISRAAMSELTAKQKKALFVRVGFKGDPTSVRQIPRFRLTTANINRVFNCDAEFLQEEATGNIVWPKNWQTDCLPPPYLYNISEKVWPELDPDAMEQDEYRGKVLVVCDNVPEEVTAKMLVSWLNTGLDDDDPDLASARMQLEELRESLQKVEKQIKELPALKSAGTNAKEELEFKKKRAQALNMQKVDLEEDIRALAEKFDQLRRDRESMNDTAFNVRLAESKMPLRLNVWEVRFSKDKKGQRLAYIACHKYNWAEFRIAVHRYSGHVITGKAELPQMTKEYQEINMRNVTVSRRRHGIGMYRFPDERGFYSGHFRHGLRHGVGTEVNVQGRFQGRLERDWRSGPGTQVYANGDTYRGAYGGSRYHDRESLIYGDEYADGLPHGKGRMRFVDGSLYEGEFKDGIPSGHGKYVGSTGVVTEGQFGRWCCLDGYGSWTFEDVTRIGTWRDGMMYGKGTEIDTVSGTYEGEYWRGEKHGYGRLDCKLVNGLHEGWWKSGFRWGLGTLNWGNVDRDTLTKKARAEALKQSMKSKSMNVGVGEDAGEDSDGEEDGPRDGNGRTIMEDGFPAGVPTTMDGPSHNEYKAMQGQLNELIPYRGDFGYDGRWRAGTIRQGGVLTIRYGQPEPNTAERQLTTNGVNPLAAALHDLAKTEQEQVRKRTNTAKLVYKAHLEKRLTREAENAASFLYWRKIAAAALIDVKRRTRRGKGQLEEIKEAIAKPERAAGEEDVYDDDDDYEDEDDGEGVAAPDVPYEE